jgi:hypothetical protein
LTDDAVPLVAYALLQGQLPLGLAADPEKTAERANDALLAHADWVSSVVPGQRQVFLELSASPSSSA